MNRIIYILILVLLFTGCSGQSKIKRSRPVINVKDDNRYEYYLMEAIRQKYSGQIGNAAGLFEKCIELDRSRPVPYYELSQIYAGMNYAEKAVKYARIAANSDRKNFWYQLSAGSVFLDFVGRDSAIVYFKRALVNNPESLEVKRVIAGLYTENRENEKADSLISELEEAGAIDEQMYLIMISNYMEEGNTEEAANRTMMLIEKYPSDIRYRALLAEIYSETGDIQKSDSIYKNILISNPDEINAKILMLGSRIKRGNYDGTDQLINGIIASEQTSKEQKAGIIRELTLDSSYVKISSSVIEYNISKLEEKYSGDEDVMILRPLLYEQEGRVEEAIGLFEEIVKKFERNFFVKEKLMILYAEKKDYLKLYGLSSKYSSENNRSLLGKVYYAIAAMELMKYDIAESELKKALILSGNDDNLKFQVLNMIADLNYRKKDFENSFRYIEEALEIIPDDVGTLNNYAYYLAESNMELQKALKMAESVVARDRRSTYLDTYAWVLYKQKKFREAHKIMKEIFEREKVEDPEINEHMGYILEKMDKCVDAVEFWRKAIEQDSTKIYLNKEINQCLQEKQ